MSPPHESIDLRDFDESAGPVPAQVTRRAAFYGDLTRFATRSTSGRRVQTAVSCRRRPGNKPCRGLMVVRRQDLPSAIAGECPRCGATVHISEWENTAADLRGCVLGPEEETWKGFRKVSVPVSTHSVLREIARIDASLIPLVYRVEVEDSELLIPVTEEEALRHGASVLVHAFASTSPRQAQQLVDFAAALTDLTDESAAGSASLDSDGIGGDLLTDVLLGLESASASEFLPVQPPPRTKGRKRRKTPPKTPARTYQLKVTLQEVEPPIWRRLQVPSDISLANLHRVLQAAMGWQGYHLHLFQAGERSYAPRGGDFDPIGEDSKGIRLQTLAPGEGSRLEYVYDLGDEWRHEILVEEVLDEPCVKVRCLKGQRACPPEDAGGAWGYQDLCAAVADPGHKRHEEAKDWMPEGFDPDRFDVVETDALVRRVKV